MGAQASTNIAKEVSETVSNSFQSCGEQSGKTVTNTVDLNGVKFTEPDWCPAGSTGFNIQQGASVDASCLLGSLQNNIASTVAKLNTEVKGGIGFQASTSVSDIKNKIESNNSQVCAGKSISNDASISDIDVMACNMAIVQNAKVKEACQINNTQKQANDIIANAKVSTTGWFGGTWGIIGIVIIIIVVVILLGVGGYFMYSSQQQTTEKAYQFAQDNPEVVGTAIQTAALVGGTDWSYSYIIIAIIIVVLMIYAWGYDKTGSEQKADVYREQTGYQAQPETSQFYYEEESIEDYYKPLLHM